MQTQLKGESMRPASVIAFDFLGKRRQGTIEKVGKTHVEIRTDKNVTIKVPFGLAENVKIIS